MSTTTREVYLVNEVMTATPQKLQLMLLDAALRHAHAAGEHRQAGRLEEAGESIIRCQEIVSEILSALQPKRDQELCRRVAAIYLFVFRRLVAAHLKQDDEPLREAISLLETERETWRQVCELHGATRLAHHLAPRSGPGDEPQGGLSLEV